MTKNAALFFISVALLPMYTASAEEAAYRVVEVEEMGKHGPIRLTVTIYDSSYVRHVEVLDMREVKGNGIKKREFLDQFNGKSANDPLRIGRDIDAVTGATISSKAVCKAIRKALAAFLIE